LLLKKYDMTMYVIPGNHEDWDFIEEMEVQDDGWQHYRSNVLVAPRGLRWEWEGVSFVGLGGAPSVDRTWRVAQQDASGGKHKYWWEQEDISQEVIDDVAAAGYADVMVTHDAPFGFVDIESKIAGNPFGFAPADIAYGYEGRQKMLTALHGVQPKLFLHGHYHFPVDGTYNVPSGPMLRDIKFSTHMLGLNCDGSNFSLGQLDLETLEAHAWNRERYNY
jgi:Icc-related predicted phosphoesterase